MCLICRSPTSNLPAPESRSSSPRHRPRRERSCGGSPLQSSSWRTVRNLERSIRKGLASEVDRDRGTTISTIEGFDPLASRPVERVLWLRPTRAILDAGVALIDRAAQDTALVAVVGSGPLDRWRVGARVRFRRSDSAVDPVDVARYLVFSTRARMARPGPSQRSRRARGDRCSKDGSLGYRRPRESTGFRSSTWGASLWALGVWIGRRSTFASSSTLRRLALAIARLDGWLDGMRSDDGLRWAGCPLVAGFDAVLGARLNWRY